jgi:hypothetical protein
LSDDHPMPELTGVVLRLLREGRIDVSDLVDQQQ